MQSDNGQQRTVTDTSAAEKKSPSLNNNRPCFERRYRRLTLDMHIPDWDPELLSKYDPAAMTRLFKKGGITAVYLEVQSHTGLCLWPTKVGGIHRAALKRDLTAGAL